MNSEADGRLRDDAHAAILLSSALGAAVLIAQERGVTLATCIRLLRAIWKRKRR